MFEAYRERVYVDGVDHQDGLMNSTKRQVETYIQASPSKSVVDRYKIAESQEEDNQYKLEHDGDQLAIVSEKETFYKQKILFVPDEGIDIGSYIKYKKRVYLLTEMSEIDGYPSGMMEFCNFPLTFEYGETIKVQTGTDDRGRPTYSYETPTITLPVNVTDKIYSELNNAQVPLPEGAILIKIPYHPIVKIKINDILQVFDNEVQVTTVSPTNLLLDDNGNYYGYFEIRCGRKQETT